MCSGLQTSDLFPSFALGNIPAPPGSLPGESATGVSNHFFFPMPQSALAAYNLIRSQGRTEHIIRSRSSGSPEIPSTDPIAGNFTFAASTFPFKSRPPHVPISRTFFFDHSVHKKPRRKQGAPRQKQRPFCSGIIVGSPVAGGCRPTVARHRRLVRRGFFSLVL